MLCEKKNGFTLVEMLIVIGMLGILMAATFTSVARARVVARITKANTETRQLIGAILAFEAAEGEDFFTALGISGEEPVEATEGNLAELLGMGQKTQIVYLNAPMRGIPRAFRDPWGIPYQIRIIEKVSSEIKDDFSAAITFPNRNRIVP
jgi:prepilin-type N-terminal cleavage/methylation domain-containing protein